MTHEETEKKYLKDMDNAIWRRCDRVFTWTMLLYAFIQYCACVAIAYAARSSDVIDVCCYAYPVIAMVRGYHKGHEEYVMDRYRGVVINGCPLEYSERDAKQNAESTMTMYFMVGGLGALVIWFAAMATYTFIVK